MVKQGDRVRLEGREATVETQWGSGKHTTSRLSDGREVLDLHVLVSSGVAEVLEARPEPAPERELTRRERRDREREETPVFGEDHED
jgi:hypothetical protein